MLRILSHFWSARTLTAVSGAVRGLEPRVVADHASKRGKAPSGDARGLEEVNYFLTISLKIGTEFQPKATFETPSLWPPVAPWYQSGIDGMSSRRIS